MRNIKVKVNNDKERDAVLKNFGELGCKWIMGEEAMEFKPRESYPYYLVRHYGRIGFSERADNCKTIPAERFMKDMKKITIVSDGKTVTATDEKGRKGIAKCSPEDTFSLGYGAKLAIERIEEIKVGDEVEVTNSGKGYTTYYYFFKHNDIDIEYAARYRYGMEVPEHCKMRVVGIHKHETCDRDIAILEDIGLFNDRGVFLVDVRGLKKV